MRARQRTPCHARCSGARRRALRGHGWDAYHDRRSHAIRGKELPRKQDTNERKNLICPVRPADPRTLGVADEVDDLVRAAALLHSLEIRERVRREHERRIHSVSRGSEVTRLFGGGSRGVRGTARIREIGAIATVSRR